MGGVARVHVVVEEVRLGRAGVEGGPAFVCFKAGYFFNEVMPWQI